MPVVGEGYASKKQTPFSVWYTGRIGGALAGHGRLKEADAFQRLVLGEGVGRGVELDAPQRSRRLSASGMRGATPTR